MGTKLDICLRRIERDDLPDLLNWRNDPSLMKYFRQVSELSEAEHLNWFEKMQLDKSVEMFKVDAFDRCYTTIGVCGLTSIDYINSRAEFSLYIAPEFQREGYGKQALNLLLDQAFNKFNLHLVWGESFEYNPAREMFKKMGFIEEGARRDFYYKDGRYIDAYLYSITREEWTKQKKKS